MRTWQGGRQRKIAFIQWLPKAALHLSNGSFTFNLISIWNLTHAGEGRLAMGTCIAPWGAASSYFNLGMTLYSNEVDSDVISRTIGTTAISPVIIPSSSLTYGARIETQTFMAPTLTTSIQPVSWMRMDKLVPAPPDTKEEGHITFGYGRRSCLGWHADCLVGFGLELPDQHMGL